MKAERQHQEIQSRTIQPKRKKLGGTPIVDNRNIAQAKLINPIQRVGLFGEEEDAVQGKFVTQLQEEDKETFQGRSIANGILQKRAWQATRPLGQVPQVAGLNPMGHKTDSNLGFRNMKLNHRHIIFDANHNLPTGDRNNIGFHCAGGGARGIGKLFSENVERFGYTNRGEISATHNEDNRLIRAINANQNFGNYNVLTHNCQDWVSRVRATAGL